MMYCLRKTRPETHSTAFNENSKQLLSEKKWLTRKTWSYKFYSEFFNVFPRTTQNYATKPRKYKPKPFAEKIFKKGKHTK